MSNVVDLKGRTIIGQVDIDKEESKQDISALLQKFVEMNDRGELTSIAVVAVQHDGVGWTRYIPGEQTMILLGNVNLLQRDLTNEWKPNDA